jgi:phage FluMu gp28-like protein
MTLPALQIESSSLLPRYFLPHQLRWIEAEAPFHQQRRPVFALAEKSVRIGWTYADAFKNVRKRLRFSRRDYLFATKDYPSALEYMQLCYMFAGVFDLTRAVLSHGEDYLQVPRLDPDGQPTGFTDEIKIGLIKFDNGSRIIAFSSNPYAMAVHGGDVGLDEFAKHPNASLLWQTAQGRVTWGSDLAVWSAHDGEDTLFNQFAQQARAACLPKSQSPSIATQNSELENPAPPIKTQNSTIKNPWNLYFRVTMEDAAQFGLVDLINRTKGTALTAQQFLADCRARSGSDEIYQQSYMCNPLGAATASIVEWSAIERCRYDYQIERLHLESDQVLDRFGQFDPATQCSRQSKIHDFLQASFPNLFSRHHQGSSSASSDQNSKIKTQKLLLGFDVAASGQGDLAVFYLTEARDSALWLRALLTLRTEDWHFLRTVLDFFLDELRTLKAAADESGLGRQICWETAAKYGSNRFLKVNFTAKKQDLGFSLMNQLSVAEIRFPRSEQDIAADFFALRKFHTGTRWTFTEGRNSYNPASHCDIAWAAALASHAHTEMKSEFSCAVLHENCWFDGKDYHPYGPSGASIRLSPEQAALGSNDPDLWRPLY